MLSSVLAANLTQVGVRQNQDMRKMRAWAAILAVPTALAGVYGMNFDHMPELGWHLGYPAALATMVLVHPHVSEVQVDRVALIAASATTESGFPATRPLRPGRRLLPTAGRSPAIGAPRRARVTVLDGDQPGRHRDRLRSPAGREHGGRCSGPRGGRRRRRPRISARRAEPIPPNRPVLGRLLAEVSTAQPRLDKHRHAVRRSVARAGVRGSVPTFGRVTGTGSRLSRYDPHQALHGLSPMHPLGARSMIVS